ncbi:MAG: hypothetical protein SVG88_11575 [Halobacteriales archaeon]|nr:hypothetical protein [Halobacteriales archaeon]
MTADEISIDADDPPVPVLNTLAAEQRSDGWSIPDTDRATIESKCRSLLDDRLDRQRTLKAETMLSKREAEVVALKESGLTLTAIALVFTVSDRFTRIDPDDPTTGVQLVENHFQRAQQKYEHSIRTVDELADLFDSET